MKGKPPRRTLPRSTSQPDTECLDASRGASVATPASSLRDAMRRAARRPAQPLRTARAEPRLREPTPAGAISVFLAYAHEDDALVLELKAALVAEGFDVHSDHDFRGGTDYGRRIRQLIAETDNTIVLWTPVSVQRPYVIGEAKLALRAQKLVCVHRDGLDPLDIPLEFNHLNSIPLSQVDRIVRSLR